MREYDIEVITGFHLQAKTLEAMNRRSRDGWRVAFVNVGDGALVWLTFEREMEPDTQRQG